MSTDTNIPTPRTDAASFMIFEGIAHRGEIVVPAAECEKLERELADISGQLERRNDGFRKAIDLCVEKDREIERLKTDLSAARKDSERLKWLFSGYAVARWRYEHEVGAVDRDTLMYSMFDLDDDMKAATEGGER